LRIGISGANGFIGKHVIQRLKEIENVEVIVFGRNGTNSGSELFPNHVTWDIFDENFDYELVPRVDKYIHLAWNGIPHYDQDIHLMQISNHVKLISQVMSRGCETVLTTGTCFEYENPRGGVSETAPVLGSSAYSDGKIQLSGLIQSLADKFMCQNIWARLFYVYGPDQPSNTLFGSFQRAVHSNQSEFSITNGNTKLDYLEVGALSEILVKLLFAESANGTFNVGSGSSVRVGALVNSWKTELNSQISIIDSEKQPTRDFWADIAKLRSVIN
jgi:nucleoside-diphosphate-sugar epimerase